MTHLRIEQNNIQENVSSKVITKLYEEAKNNLDNTSTLRGNLHTTATYQEYKDFLMQKFPDLYINADKYYISFEDPEVQRILAETIGDGIGTSSTDILVTTTFNQAFHNNTKIEVFNELSLFKNLNTLARYGMYYNGWGDFQGCTNIRSIDLSNIKYIRQASFQNCSNLTYLGENFKPIQLQDDYGGRSGCFSNCTSLTSVDLSECTDIGKTAFSECTALSNVVSLSQVRCIGDLAFFGCTSLTGVISLPNLGTTPTLTTWDENSYIGQGAFRRSNITGVDDLGIITLIPNGNYLDGESDCGIFSYCTQLRYVILPSTLTQLGNLTFMGCTALQYVKCLATTPPTIESQDEDIDGSFSSHPFRGAARCKIYVPDSDGDTVLTAYKQANGWNKLASYIFPMSKFSIDFPND